MTSRHCSSHGDHLVSLISLNYLVFQLKGSNNLLGFEPKNKLVWKKLGNGLEPQRRYGTLPQIQSISAR